MFSVLPTGTPIQFVQIGMGQKPPLHTPQRSGGENECQPTATQAPPRRTPHGRHHTGPATQAPPNRPRHTGPATQAPPHRPSHTCPATQAPLYNHSHTGMATQAPLHTHNPIGMATQALVHHPTHHPGRPCRTTPHRPCSTTLKAGSTWQPHTTPPTDPHAE